MKGNRQSGTLAGAGNLGRERNHDNVGPDGYRKTSPNCGCGHTMGGKKSKKSKRY